MKRGIITILIIGFPFYSSILGSGFSSFTMLQSAMAQDEFSLSESRFQIRLKTRVFTPPAESGTNTLTNTLSNMQSEAARSVLPSDTMHFLIQFDTLPDASEKKKLEAQGIRLIAYVTGNAYIASTRVSKFESLSAAAASLSESNTRWIGALEPEDKLSEALRTGEIGSWARTEDGRVILTIQFHSDVNLEVAENLLKALGGEILSKVSTVSSITAIFDVDKVKNIAVEDSVQYVDAVEPPLEDHNDGARNAANVAPLANAPYNLTGAGVTVLVYDSGIIDVTHPDFAARVIQTDPDPTETTRDHSTHVAGTVGGSGANSNGNDSVGTPNGGTANQWAGMAPGINIRSFATTGGAVAFYDGNGGDLNADFTTAINNGIDLATMSQGHNTSTCNLLGDYTNTAILLDNIVRGSIAGQQLIYIESAGNERGALGCNQFNSISSPATCKNTVVVGSINSNDNTLSGFSSIGPTDDGRLKPDITAPGCQNTGDLGITSPSFVDADGDGNLDAGETQNAYVVKCGTSMATPVVAGSTALLIEQWRSTRGAGTTPLPHTVKAVLVHTSTDLGNAGPDYSFGWGALDAQAAVDLVIADDTATLIHVDQVDVGDTDFYTFNSGGIGNVQVTLAWDESRRLSTT
jgi:subtilisin family serine protease